jgi:hypothetical protein
MNLFCIQFSNFCTCLAHVSNSRDQCEIFLRPDWMMPTHVLRYLSVRLSRMRSFQRFGKHGAKASHMHHNWQLQRTYILNCCFYLCVVVTDHRILRKGCQVVPGIMVWGPPALSPVVRSIPVGKPPISTTRL